MGILIYQLASMQAETDHLEETHAADHPFDPDDTGIALSSSSLAGSGPARRDLIRVGPFMIAAAPFSWAMAITLHVIVVGVAVYAAGWLWHPPGYSSKWGGANGQVSVCDASEQAADSPSLPGKVGSPAVSATRFQEASDATEESGSTSPVRMTHVDLAPDATDEQVHVIGVAGALAGGAPPAFHASNRPGSSNKASSSLSSADSAAKSSVSAASSRGDDAGEGVTAHAGLPGSLSGAGMPAPNYPIEARQRHQQGVVKVAIEVLPDGSLGAIHVISDPGYPLLREAALVATKKLRRFTFIPARRFGHAVRDYLVIPYHFILQ